MVHALETIHGLLKPDGILLDIHPTNEPATIAVRLRERLIPAGWVQESDDYVEYEWADEALQRVVRQNTASRCPTSRGRWAVECWKRRCI